MNSLHNVLVADDSADDVFLLQEAFKMAEATSRLHAVTDGAEAVAYLKGEQAFGNRELHPFPDVLLLDLNMPRMNGFEVLEWVRREPCCSRLVVHVLTASGRESDVQRAYDLHANSYTIKPNRLDELVGFISALHQWHRFITLPPALLSEEALAQQR
jgi:two-component system response regulator